VAGGDDIRPTEDSMFRSLLLLFAVGVGGFVALGLVTAIVAPLLGLAIKIAFIVLIGYLILRLIKPDKAEEMRKRFKSS
jgi:hypothetical protein